MNIHPKLIEFADLSDALGVISTGGGFDYIWRQFGDGREAIVSACLHDGSPDPGERSQIQIFGDSEWDHNDMLIQEYSGPLEAMQALNVMPDMLDSPLQHTLEVLKMGQKANELRLHHCWVEIARIKVALLMDVTPSEVSWCPDQYISNLVPQMCRTLHIVEDPDLLAGGVTLHRCDYDGAADGVTIFEFAQAADTAAYTPKGSLVVTHGADLELGMPLEPDSPELEATEMAEAV